MSKGWEWGIALGLAVAGPTAFAASSSRDEGAARAWRAAVEGTHTEANRRVDAGGVTEYMACFKSGSPRCALPAFAMSDPFRKTSTFEPAASRLAKHVSSRYLRSYVVLSDCERPIVVLNPSYFSKSSWLFINRAAVLADGQVIIDQPLDSQRVRRDNDAAGVTETATWVATREDVDALRRAALADKVIVRFTGEKGFVTVSPSDVAGFKRDALDITTIFDKLDSAVAAKSCVP